MEHDEYKAILIAHAVGALSPEEERTLSDHLESCRECSAEAVEWQNTASLLAYSAPASSPAPEVRNRLLARVRSVGKDEPEKHWAGDELKASSHKGSNVIAFSTPVRRTWLSSNKFGAIAASLILAVLLISLVLSLKRNSQLASQLAQSQNQQSEIRAELAQRSDNARHTEDELGQVSRHDEELRAEMDRLKNQDQELQKQIAELRVRGHGSETPRTPGAEGLFTAPDSRVVMLAGTSAAPNAHARMAFDRKTGQAMMVAYGLPQPPAGKAYQLWFISGGKPMPGPVFRANAAGRATMHTQVPTAGLNASTFAVTLEPQGGVSAPTGEKYLLGSGI